MFYIHYRVMAIFQVMILLHIEAEQPATNLRLQRFKLLMDQSCTFERDVTDVV